MVRVKSSSGGNVSIQIVGIKETIERLKKFGFNVDNKVDKELMISGAKVSKEVQNSIMGRSDEKKSVDTGTFANSIHVERKNKSEVVVKPRNISYQNGTPVNLVALFLEEGTSINPTPKKHFQNSAKRMQPKIKNDMQLIIKGAVKEF